MQWLVWLNKKVFLRTRNGRVYSGVINDVDDGSLPLVWITMLDRRNKLVQFSSDEIVEIKEEE